MLLRVLDCLGSSDWNQSHHVCFQQSSFRQPGSTRIDLAFEAIEGFTESIRM